MDIWIQGFLFRVREYTGFLSEHMLLKAVDYLGSRGAGLLIATQKLMSKEKTEEREQQRGGVPLVTADTRRKES